MSKLAFWNCKKGEPGPPGDYSEPDGNLGSHTGVEPDSVPILVCFIICC